MRVFLDTNILLDIIEGRQKLTSSPSKRRSNLLAIPNLPAFEGRKNIGEGERGASLGEEAGFRRRFLTTPLVA